jgi:hypothetical protein
MWSGAPSRAAARHHHDHHHSMEDAMTGEVLTPTSPRWDEFCGQLSVAVLSAGCKHGFDHARRIMDAMGAINIPESLSYFRQHGGFCDIEILLNVMCDNVTEAEFQAFERRDPP